MTTVIVIQKRDEVEVYKSLVSACSPENNPKFSYHYLRTKKFPFKMYGYHFVKRKIIK